MGAYDLLGIGRQHRQVFTAESSGEGGEVGEQEEIKEGVG